MLKISSTNPHKLNAERVARALKKTIPILIRKGVLQPPPAQTTHSECSKRE